MSAKVCTFFGHRDTPSSILPQLRETLTALIEQHGVDTFYVGNQGAFDRMVRDELRRLTGIYPHIRYAVMLAYMPTQRQEADIDDYTDTVYPEGLETVPRRFAIDKRNRLMIDRADIVVTYVCRVGGAAKFREIAEKKGKCVIDLA